MSVGRSVCAYRWLCVWMSVSVSVRLFEGTFRRGCFREVRPTPPEDSPSSPEDSLPSMPLTGEGRQYEVHRHRHHHHHRHHHFDELSKSYTKVSKYINTCITSSESNIQWLKCNGTQGKAVPPTSNLWLKAFPHLRLL